MSHHLDTPLARQSGQLFIDDLYVYDANDATVFAMDVNSTITGPDITPGFGHEARYEFRIHFDGADVEALTYRVTFAEPEADGRQALQLHALSGGDARSARQRVSSCSPVAWAKRRGRTICGCGPAGSRIRSTSISRLLDKVNGSVRTEPHWISRAGIPTGRATASPGRAWRRSCSRSPTPNAAEARRSIGVWCVTHLETDAGGWRQINRGGHPMMWPIFWPDDVKFTDPANTRHPSEDYAAEARRLPP